MSSRIAGLAGVIVATLLACSSPAHAGTSTITFSQKGTAAPVNVFFFVGPTPSLLFMFTGVDSTGRSFSGQMLINIRATSKVTCTFIGPGGISESGHVENLMGGAGITITPGVGRLYSVAVPAAGVGCSNHKAISLTENENIEGGGGSYANATGTRILQFLGTLNLNAVTGFIKATGSATITVP